METLQRPAPVVQQPRKSPARKPLTKADWLIPAGLVVLSLVPMLGGGVRLMQLVNNAAITPENARFFASPEPVVLHIFASLLYCVVGAFQFSQGIRRRNMKWHRRAGWVLVSLGLVSALSGLWMTLFYSFPKFDGVYLYAIRLIVGTAMAASIVLAVMSVRKKNISGHEAWMMRAYAIGIGAGTQVFTHIPLIVAPEMHNELTRTLCMAAGWAINIAIAEWIIARRRKPRIANRNPLAL